MLVASLVQPALARDRVPLPKPRPVEAPAAPHAREPQSSEEAAAPPQEGAPAKPADSTPEPPPPSACRLALTEAVAIAPSIPDITAPGGCGGTDLVKLEAVVLADGSRVAVAPAAILRCPMARAVADWIRGDMAPLAASLGSRVALLDNFDSYECRGRNRVRGAKLSEHGRANAIDLRGLKLANGRMLALTDRETPRPVRETVLQSVCARFTTVLGPGSDGYHEDHIHLDLAERRGGYRICQWEVWDALPAIAPLLPAPRPDEAPPRDVAAGKERAPQAGASAQPEAAEPAQAEEADRQQADAPPPPPSKPGKRAKPKAATGKPAESKPAESKPRGTLPAKPAVQGQSTPAGKPLPNGKPAPATADPSAPRPDGRRS